MRHAVRALLAAACFSALQLILHHWSLLRRHGKPLSFDEAMKREKAGHRNHEIDF